MSGCIFCNNFDFRTARAAKTSTGTVLIELSGGNTYFNSMQSFNYCPVCGRKLKPEVYRWISGMDLHEQWVGYTIMKLFQVTTSHPEIVPTDAEYEIRIVESCDTNDSIKLTENTRLIEILREYPFLFDAVIKKVKREDNRFIISVNLTQLKEEKEK